ncbi:hypothetical protein ACNHKD_07175 [Methylocystis sp. JAN1]|uniref:hypothetical protein n=1 Tax=Methylocystis sp. JAN1 TaxID=3397211 RepID=UPI003FA22E22
MTKLTTLAILAFFAADASAVMAADANCSSSSPIAAGATVTGRVVVPDGQTCDISGVSVIGDLVVGRQATLKMRGGTVAGNVEATECAEVLLRGEAAPLLVRGDVQIRGCSGKLDYGSLWVAGFIDGTSGRAMVAGDVECVGNAALCAVYKVDVGGNVRVDGNVANGSPSQNNVSALLTSNLIGKKLECAGNGPNPITYGPNVAASGKLGQCAAAGF